MIERNSLAALLLGAFVAACASSSASPDATPEASATPSAAPTALSAEQPSASAVVAPTAPAATATASAVAAPPAVEPKGVCDPANAAAALASFEQAKPFLDKVRKEDHPTQQEWDKNMATLLSAAEAGLLDAQYEYGRILFGSRFTEQAPTKSEEADYVRALQLIRAAAVRGHEPARKLFPELAQPKLPAKLDMPLKDLPRAWVDKAVKKADDWVAKCGKP